MKSSLIYLSNVRVPLTISSRSSTPNPSSRSLSVRSLVQLKALKIPERLGNSIVYWTELGLGLYSGTDGVHSDKTLGNKRDL